MSTNKVVIGSLSILGGGAMGILSTYLYTLESVWSMGARDFLPTNASPEDWALLHSQLKSSKEVDWSEKIKDWEDLRGWCSAKYKESFNHIFKSPEWVGLGYAKNLCVLRIENRLKALNKELFEGEWSKDISMEKNISKLKENNGGFKLTNKLERIRVGGDMEKIKWGLWHWCKSVYGKGFQGTNSSMYKLVEEFCIKEK